MFRLRMIFMIKGHDYYVKLVGRLVQSLQGKTPFPFMDWRFNEFPNEGAHALYVSCVEVMGLPVSDSAQAGIKFFPKIIEITSRIKNGRVWHK
jgi:hypothetical protein